MRLLLCTLALSAAAYATVMGGSAESNRVRTHPHSQHPGPVQQIIVKLRATEAAVTSGAVPEVSSQTSQSQRRIVHLAVRSGLSLKDSRQLFDRTHVLQVEPASDADSVSATIERLNADPDVEYALPDERRYIHAVPNDPLYSAGGQWYEHTDPATPSAINAQAAWDYSTGDANLVIADLDTGVRFDHPDLLAAANSGRLLPGYDFISNAAVANDGDARDADASDPGDWVNSTDKGSSQFKDCDEQISSWHGTRTAGILGALSNNLHGISGITWQGKILPVRVLGKCGGYDSDILDAMQWAAGIHIDGVPDNTHPARIINMSLGSSGNCPQFYSDVLTRLTSMGVLVVVSAGNEGGPVDSPANCPGVAAIAGIRHAGTKVGYSSLGPSVTLSAPAGNCVNTVGTCVYSIQTTTNSGSATPVANDDAYTGTSITADEQPLGPNLGTSFSAPVVAGIAQLMLAINSNLTTCQLLSRLKEGSLPFPQTSATQPAPPMCHVPVDSADVQNLECICTLDGKTCGAGMANAKGAVEAALRPIAAVSLPASVSAGQAVSLNASNSAAANGHAISTYQWTNIGKQSVSIQNATSAAATVTAPSCGLATVQLSVTDDVGRTDTANVVLDPTSAKSTAPTSATSKSCTTTTLGVLLEVCPASANVQAGGATQSFTATVANTTNDGVTWEVDGTPGGDAIVGTISSTGVYTPPAQVPPASQVMVTAVSNADQAMVSSSTVTISAPAGSHGGGAIDPITLFAEVLALGAAVGARRRHANRCAASSQDF
jgi:serine protease